MKSFFKIFFASFVALIVFSVLAIIIFSLILGAALRPEKTEIGGRAVLVLDLSKQYYEQTKQDPLSFINDKTTGTVPGLFDVVRMLHYAKSDTAVKGLYIKADANANGFGTSEELRAAVLDFKHSGKFVLAYGETIDQRSYYVASAAQKVFCHPNGGLEWTGFSINYIFFKGLLDKLEIEPQIFYAGKYKSATEPFRVKEMTDPNRVQTTQLLNDIYGNFLATTARDRHLDSTDLHALALEGKIQTAMDAYRAHLIDGLMYDDEIKNELQKRLYLKKSDKINFVSLADYADARNYKSTAGDRIAVIYAEGDIIDGKSESERVVASENFVAMIRKVRMDDDVKALVFRVNSPGGSALASDAIWREIVLTKKVKPVVVSMGDYAASGGYYISCAADSIFAEPGTLTGSIGVFGILPNFKSFFNDKLGITFDGVKTAPYADMGNVTRPLSETERRFVQASIDTTYEVFKTRVADGRKLNKVFVDSIAQGHVYTGTRAVELRLADKIGSLQDAINSAARLANLKSYRLREYPEQKSIIEQLMSGSLQLSLKQEQLKNTLGTAQFKYYEQIKNLDEMSGSKQAKLIAIPEIN